MKGKHKLVNIGEICAYKLEIISSEAGTFDYSEGLKYVHPSEM